MDSCEATAVASASLREHLQTAVVGTLNLGGPLDSDVPLSVVSETETLLQLGDVLQRSKEAYS